MKKRHSLSSRSWIALVCASLLAGCSQTPAQDSSALQPSSSQAQALPEMSDAEKNGYTAFSWNLFSKTLEENQNNQISPLSAFYALGMCLNGAAGETRTQIETMLGMDAAQVNQAASALLSRIEADKASQLQLADSLWINRSADSEVRQDYRDLLERDYQAEVFERNFDGAITEEINSWVSSHTGGQIPKLVESLGSDAVLVLINALNFDAKWENPYYKHNLRQGEFTDASGAVHSMEFMDGEENLFVRTQNLKGFIKPYAGGIYGFAALVPEQEDADLDEVLSKLDSAALFEALASPEKKQVETALPSFDQTQQTKLNEILQAMGMKDAFSDLADFSNLSENGRNLAVSEVLQKTKIQVNSEGTKAAAATEVEISEMSLLEPEETERVDCSRPFLYLLLNLETGTPLMIGTLQSPEAAEQS